MNSIYICANFEVSYLQCTHSFVFFRCQLRDAQLVSIEKDAVIKELKDKVLELSGIIRKSRANGGDFQVTHFL